jgi:hypothetical protein
MKKVKVTFEISEAVMDMLDKRVPEQERNSFIEKAIHCMFSTMEQERLLRDIVEHNKARDDELEEIDNSLEPEPEDLIFKNVMTNIDEFLDDDELSELDDIV